LLRLVFRVGWEPGSSLGSLTRASAELSRRLADPPIPQLAANSLLLGLEVAVVIVVLAWLARPASHVRSSRTIWSHVVLPIACMPPLLQGVGILSLPWLAEVAARSLR